MWVGESLTRYIDRQEDNPYEKGSSNAFGSSNAEFSLYCLQY